MHRIRRAAVLLICLSLTSCARFFPAEIAVITPETAAEVSVADENTAYTYVINKNSMKFHLPDCSGVKNMKEANRENTSESREALIARGCTPCGTCTP